MSQTATGFQVTKRVHQSTLLTTALYENLHVDTIKDLNHTPTPTHTPHTHTCQQTFGFLRDRMCCVRGDGSSSYLSKGKFSTSIGSLSVGSNQTMGWASLGGCGRDSIESVCV